MKNGGAGDVQGVMNTPNLTELATALASLTTADRDAVLAEAFSIVAKMRSAAPYVVAFKTPDYTNDTGRYSKIDAIKALRNATGFGLGEAKAAIEAGTFPGERTALDATELASKINAEWAKVAHHTMATVAIAAAVPVPAAVPA